MSTGETPAPPASPEKRDRVRKRTDSIGDEGSAGRTAILKKPRTTHTLDDLLGSSSSSSSGLSFSISARIPSSSQESSYSSYSHASSSTSPSLSLYLDKLPAKFPTSLSRRSSMTSVSRDYSPIAKTQPSPFDAVVDTDSWSCDSLHARILRRSASSASLRSMSPAPSVSSEPVYAAESARNFMRNPKFVVDYVRPTIVRSQPAQPTAPAEPASTATEVATDNQATTTVPAAEPVAEGPAPQTPAGGPGFVAPPPAPERHPRELPPSVQSQILACSATGVLFFTRGNRLHFKNLTANEEVGQVCKVQQTQGHLTALACGGSAETGYVVATATSKGHIAIYDTQTKKRLLEWTTKPVGALAWNNKTLTVGGVSGTIWHYDTRISPVEKMKEQALTVTRHQAPITRMEWNADGNVLASADKKGNVYCWKSGDKVPLDIGEFVMRRKKIKHSAAISAVSWCPWKPKDLITADIKGIIHFWTVDPSNKDSNAMTPSRLDTGSSITGLHWSTQCREFLTTHGYKIPENLAPPPPPAPSASAGPLSTPCPPLPAPNVENTLAVWQFPTLRFVTNMRMNTTDVPIGNSVVFAKGMKVVFAVPEQGKIHACDVWGKKKPEIKLRRQSSLDYVGCIR